MRHYGPLTLVLLLLACSAEPTPTTPGRVEETRVIAIAADSGFLFYAQQVAPESGSTLRIGAIGTEKSLVELGDDETWGGAHRGSQFVKAGMRSQQSGLFEWHGGKRTLLDGSPTVVEVVADDAGAYWVDDRGLVTLTGGTVSVLVPHDALRQDPTSQSTVHGLALDENAVYYLETTRYVHRVSRTDGADVATVDLDALFEGSARAPQPAELVLDAGSLYATLNNQNGAETGGLARIDKQSLTPELVWQSTRNPLGLAISQDTLYVTENLRGGERPDGAIVRLQTDGSSPTSFVGGQDGPVDVAVVDGRVFWLCNPTKELRSTPVE